MSIHIDDYTKPALHPKSALRQGGNLWIRSATISTRSTLSIVSLCKYSGAMPGQFRMQQKRLRVSARRGDDIVDGERRFNLKAVHWINIRSNGPGRSINPSSSRAQAAIQARLYRYVRAPRHLSRERLCFHVHETSRRVGSSFNTLENPSASVSFRRFFFRQPSSFCQ